MTDFHGTNLQELVKNLILSASGLGIGVVIYLIGRNVKQAVHTHASERRLNISYATARIGFVLIILLIAEAVFKRPGPIPLEWRTITYTVAILMASLGYLGVAIESRRLPRTPYLPPSHYRDPRDPRLPGDPRDERDKRGAGDPRDVRDPRLPGDPRDPKDPA